MILIAILTSSLSMYPPGREAWLAERNLLCPAGGLASCDNGGACGSCFMRVAREDCAYGADLPECRAGNVPWGDLCEIGGGTRGPLGGIEIYDDAGRHPCGTSLHLNNCFGGFDIYVHVYCLAPPQAPPPPPSPPAPPGPPPPGRPGSRLRADALALAEAEGESAGADGGTVALISVVAPCACLLLVAAAALWHCRRQRRARALVAAKVEAVRDAIVEHDGLVKHAVHSLPSRAYDAALRPAAGGDVEMTATAIAASSTARADCAVCLGAFADGETIRELPCKHTFHQTCIDAWLLGKGRPPSKDATKARVLPSCPLCKIVPISVPYPEHIAPPGVWETVPEPVECHGRARVHSAPAVPL